MCYITTLKHLPTQALSESVADVLIFLKDDLKNDNFRSSDTTAPVCIII